MKKTPLYDRHLALGGKIIDFGGWAMPVQYRNVIEEHQATRTKAGLFDICHMGEFEVKGPQAFDLLQWVLSRNLEGQDIGQIKLGVMTNEHGGIIDDVTVYRLGLENYLVVTNAGTKDKDFSWIETQRKSKGFSDVQVTDISDQTGKIDIQGPLSQAILQNITAADLVPLQYYHAINTKVMNIPALVSRSGYTGEDGFEIYADSRNIGEIWDKLLEIGKDFGLKPAGLGARDTLRLEAGMMLYGNDMDETVTPLEVVYGWVTNLEKDFVGSAALRKLKENGLTRKLVGFEMMERGIARHGYKVFNDGGEIGAVTSGTFTPTLQKAVGLAFVPISYNKPGTEILIQIRDHLAKARIVGLPFYKRKK
ncbi:MAG: glycine cleavage system aminomethyltransferase GcvT [Deltaproteobacteria bacterium]|nr:glycine cleavage system aminomethyltransferase GcvT [Deltaproteobacteria bacterium]